MNYLLAATLAISDVLGPIGPPLPPQIELSRKDPSMPPPVILPRFEVVPQSKPLTTAAEWRAPETERSVFFYEAWPLSFVEVKRWSARKRSSRGMFDRLRSRR